MPPQDPPTSSLLFPAAASSISRTLVELRRQKDRSIGDHLRSIEADAGFVEGVAKAYARPVVANERCGSWYVRPELKEASCYFKSTDGHTGHWGFSLRRINAHLLDVIARGDGCLIVDSTRRGKSIPDAFSKTIPIWCAVMNRILDLKIDATDSSGRVQHQQLYTPPQCVSRSEHAQIEARLDGFVDSLRVRLLDYLRPIVYDGTSRASAPQLYQRPCCCYISRFSDCLSGVRSSMSTFCCLRRPEKGSRSP